MPMWSFQSLSDHRPQVIDICVASFPPSDIDRTYLENWPLFHRPETNFRWTAWSILPQGWQCCHIGKNVRGDTTPISSSLIGQGINFLWEIEKHCPSSTSMRSRSILSCPMTSQRSALSSASILKKLVIIPSLRVSFISTLLRYSFTEAIRKKVYFAPLALAKIWPRYRTWSMALVVFFYPVNADRNVFWCFSRHMYCRKCFCVLSHWLYNSDNNAVFADHLLFGLL